MKIASLDLIFFGELRESRGHKARGKVPPHPLRQLLVNEDTARRVCSVLEPPAVLRRFFFLESFPELRGPSRRGGGEGWRGAQCASRDPRSVCGTEERGPRIRPPLAHAAIQDAGPSFHRAPHIRQEHLRGVKRRGSPVEKGDLREDRPGGNPEANRWFL